MNEERRLLHGLVSQLLDYPGEDLLNLRAGFKLAAKRMPDGSRQGLLDFLSYLGKTPLITLQEEYTRTFDLNPSLCLNLTFHKWGDDKKRSSALVELKRIYTDAGFEICGGELPDYLPMVLEFLSAGPEDSCFPLYDRYGEQLRLVASRLREMESPYACLIEALDPALRRLPI